VEERRDVTRCDAGAPLQRDDATTHHNVRARRGSRRGVRRERRQRRSE